MDGLAGDPELFDGVGDDVGSPGPDGVDQVATYRLGLLGLANLHLRFPELLHGEDCKLSAFCL